MRDTGTQNEVRIMDRTKGGKGKLTHAWPTIDAVNDHSITTVESTAITVELSNASYYCGSDIDTIGSALPTRGRTYAVRKDTRGILGRTTNVQDMLTGLWTRAREETSELQRDSTTGIPNRALGTVQINDHESVTIRVVSATTAVMEEATPNP